MSQFKNWILASGLAIAASNATYAQDATSATGKTTTITQKVHGIVTDAASKQPLAGVVVVLKSNTQINTVTDETGSFSLSNVPIGRQTFIFKLVGFDDYAVTEVPVISGKELDLSVSMNEKLTKLADVVVKAAGKDRIKPMNEFAAVSARAFSVEETRRYAAAFADPARMVQNFPGVSNAGDMDNSIVVRGNSPKGVLWRMEGIEIPNPNHFTSQGASGGPISMLNANTLGNSDFYTGAFVPEIGNALSGAFDLNLRTGNNKRAEHTVAIGTLGFELATEGPFSKNGKGSYLINYRYSSLALLTKVIDLGVGTSVPSYQDGSFKVNLPTKKSGTFTIWGLGGYNVAASNPEKDSSKWDDDHMNIKYDSRNHMYTGGISHQYFINKDGYIKTIIAASQDKAGNDADTLNPGNNYERVAVQKSSITNNAIRASVMYNQKLNAQHTFRAGVVGQYWSYNMNQRYFDLPENRWKNMLEGEGNTQFYQGYIQWKTRLSQRLSVIGGVHGSYLALNGKSSVEPRASVTYQASKNKVTLAAGLHSKPEHLSTYLFQNTDLGNTVTHPNKNLDLQRAFHGVLGYETSLPLRTKLKVELYYQHLYNIPVEQDSTTGFSIINALDVYSLLNTKPLVSEGTGTNYGVDISIERPFANNFYVLATGSLFKSTYKDYGGKEYNTRFNRGYTFNMVGGKEFKLNSSGRKIIGLNGKVLTNGGSRESVIDMALSKATGREEYVQGQYFTKQVPAYFRVDFGVYYKKNNKRATHTIQLDLQNITDRRNFFFSYYDYKSQTVKTVNQTGLFPNLSYRVEFH
ncbi:MAG TPA: TonB-dependent receptor [Flavipsychrobacter sp.]|nr:TonB-dependent receptor [Flavipsychrobacter sp.]